MNAEPTTEEAVFPLQIIDGAPTKEEAKAALKKLNARVTLDSIFAMQCVGKYVAKDISFPHVVLTRSITSLDEVDLIKEHAKELLNAGSGKSELSDIKDDEVTLTALKIFNVALMAEDRIHQTGLRAYEQCQPQQKRVAAPRRLKSPQALPNPA